MFLRLYSNCIDIQLFCSPSTCCFTITSSSSDYQFFVYIVDTSTILAIHITLAALKLVSIRLQSLKKKWIRRRRRSFLHSRSVIGSDVSSLTNQNVYHSLAYTQLSFSSSACTRHGDYHCSPLQAHS